METGSGVAHILEKGSGEFISSVSSSLMFGCVLSTHNKLICYVMSINEFKLATNKRLGYDMPRVKLKIICIARFWIDSRCWD